MCGIYFAYGAFDSADTAKACELAARGPDKAHYEYINNYENGLNIYIAFFRLAINGLGASGDQPIRIGKYTLICNGEIYNHKFLNAMLCASLTTTSDCEIILHGYIKYGVSFFGQLEGEFAFIIYDGETVVACRDTYGVRPLFYFLDNQKLILSSELKGNDYRALQFPPGHYMIYDISSNKSNKATKIFKKFIPLFTIHRWPLGRPWPRHALTVAIEKRLMSDREIGCLLSGGLDSSLVAAITAEHMPGIRTFSIGMEGSPDLHYANLVAAHIKSIHTSIVLTAEDFIAAIPATIKAIESYDVTTVRASVGNYLVGQWIARNTECKVILCGDFADEVCGGYKYFQRAPNPEEFDAECRRLVGDIHYFDGLRADRCLAAHGLEVRVPFSDPDFVETYWAFPAADRMPTINKLEKKLLRDDFTGTGLLPDEVLWRPKEAFSDGVSATDKSWYLIAREHAATQKKTEEEYYKTIFRSFYGDAVAAPYKWMPKWSPETTDPSARTII